MTDASLLPTVHSSLLAARTQIDNAIKSVEGVVVNEAALYAAIVEADGCFEAALADGWLQALANGDIELIRDIWERRLSVARSMFPAGIAKAETHP